MDPPEGTVWDIHVWQPMRSNTVRWACDVCGLTRRPFGPSPHPAYYSLMGRPILSGGPLSGGPSVGPGLGGLGGLGGVGGAVGGALAPAMQLNVQPNIAPPVDSAELARRSMRDQLYRGLRP